MQGDEINSLIYFIRGVHVMLDSDLAALYGIETKRLKEQVRRNANRFPIDFMFELTKEEAVVSRSQFATLNEGRDSSRPQFATLNTGRGSNIKYLPYAFTENGVAMLSSVLRTSTAIEVNIRIMRAFTAARQFFTANQHFFQRLSSIEYRQIQTDQRLDEVFRRLDAGVQPQQGIFFDGQVFEAYTFASDLIRSAKQSVILIDNYVDDTVLTLLDKRDKDVTAQIYTKAITQQLALDIRKHNAQFAPITVNVFDKAHDRFLCIDNTVYHLGASLKDLGRRWFAFSKMEMPATELTSKII